MKKEKIKQLVIDMLNESHQKALKNVDKILDSDCVDIDNWDEGNVPMVLPKTILTAILEYESRQYTARGTRYEKQIKKDVDYIKMFL
jgi:hypothetical protein